MKALPKHCLPHHAVLLLVYLSALFLTSRAANLPNLFYMAFNGLVLGLSAAYMRRDFDTDLFRLKRTAANVVRQIFRRDNAFYICAGMHFFYNLMVFFVISI